jgi:hypothetical protein
VPHFQAIAGHSRGTAVCPVLDVTSRGVRALFRHETEGLRRITEDSALAPEDLCRLIRNPTLFLGDGLVTYGALFRERLGDRMLLPPLASRGARPACVAELGRRRLLRGDGARQTRGSAVSSPFEPGTPSSAEAER